MTTSNFKAFSKNNPCPVCEGIKPDCRYNANDPNFIQCRTFTDAKKLEKINGYVCVKESNGHTASFKPDNSVEWTEEKRREWEAQKLARQQATKEQKQRQIACQLPAVERDKAYRRLLENLALTESDRQNLLNRGLTLEQIDRDGYRSVSQWQEVDCSLPYNLPGILRQGFGKAVLNVPNDGILCPIRDKEGLTVGCQIRLHDGIDGRYRWLSGVTAKNSDGASPHLNGELPLGIYEPDSYLHPCIWLCEGTGIKPSITRYKIGVPVVGAAGGRFDSSPETAKAAIEYLSAKYQTKILTFAIDAGDVVNVDGVPERWQKQFEFFSSLGYQCRVAWWGQITKEQNDIDELVDTSIISYITPQEFWSIVEEYKSEKPTTQDKSTTEKLPSDWAWDNWLKSRKFTPQIKSNQEKFDFGNIPDSGVIIAAKSGLGTGKTEALIKQIKASNQGAMIIGYRNNLLFQTINRASQNDLNIYHLREDDSHFMLADDCSHQAFCLDSIHHVDGYCESRDIYLDETCSVLLHGVNGGTLRDNQAKAIKILTRALEVCNRVFLLDGNLADIHADFIAKLAKNKRLIKIENQRQIPPHTIKFIEGMDIDGEIKKRDKSALIAMLCSPDVIPCIASDSVKTTKVIDKLLKECGRNGYVLNKETAGEDWAKQFLADPNKFIEENKPDYFIYSPTAESGVSITIQDYFTDKFSFFAGVLGTNSQHQMMFRLRDNTIPHYVFCPERSMVKDRSNPKTYSNKKFQEIIDDRILQSALLASHDSGNSSTVLEIIGLAISRSNDDWFELSCNLGALDNFEMDNLRKCLIHALTEAGHNVELIHEEIDEGFKVKEKQAKEAINKEHATELFNAIEYESIDEAKKVAKGNPRKEIQRRIEKTFLLDRLPGIDKYPEIWTPEFINQYYVKNREFITQQQRFYLLNNFEISQKRHEVNWFYKAINEDFFAASMKGISHLTIWALKELDILSLVDKQFHKNSPEVIEIVEKARNRDDIKLALRTEPLPNRTDGSERIAFISNLFQMLGLKKVMIGKPLVGGVQTKVYQVDNEAMQNPARLAVLECIECKFTEWMQSDKSQVDWSLTIDQTPQVEQPTTTDSTLQVDQTDELLKHENLVIISEYLEDCENPDMLADLRRCFDGFVLKAAAKLLPLNIREKIKDWLNHQFQDFSSINAT
jgi:hypothetical protein